MIYDDSLTVGPYALLPINLAELEAIRGPVKHLERSTWAPRPCCAADMTFGGRCLNCGFLRGTP